jgi:hypothetical protein
LCDSPEGLCRSSGTCNRIKGSGKGGVGATPLTVAMRGRTMGEPNAETGLAMVAISKKNTQAAWIETRILEIMGRFSYLTHIR